MGKKKAVFEMETGEKVRERNKFAEINS